MAHFDLALSVSHHGLQWINSRSRTVSVLVMRTPTQKPSYVHRKVFAYPNVKLLPGIDRRVFA